METVRFEEMGLSEEIQKAVRYMGFEEASPIQAKAIPAMISGIDLIGQAQTGTGKTAAFGIPLLEKVDPKLKKLQAIVLCPTRELAIQVADEIRNLSRYMHGIKVLPIYGGQDIVKQIRSLKSGTQIVIGTVYRNLNLLADIGEAIKITTPDGGDRFDARTNPHYHFYCKCCKRMIDMDFDHMDKINQLASESFDGQIESHTMLFYGICGDCLRKS